MMCCTKKWVGGLAALAGLVVALGVLSGTDVGRKTLGLGWVQVQKVWKWADTQVSPEDELKRIANEVDALSKDIDVKYSDMVLYEKGLEKVEKDVTTRKKDVEDQWRVIKLLQGSIEDAQAKENSFVTIEGKTTELPKARKELTDLWAAFKKSKAALDQREAELKQKRETLASMNESMNDMVQAKSEYKLKIDELQAKIESYRAAQARDAVSQESDGWKTRLTHIKESFDKISDDVDTKIAVMQTRQKELLNAKVNTGAAQAVQNEITQEEIRKYEDGLKQINK